MMSSFERNDYNFALKIPVLSPGNDNSRMKLKITLDGGFIFSVYLETGMRARHRYRREARKNIAIMTRYALCTHTNDT